MPSTCPLTLHVELGPLQGTSFDSGRLKHVTVGRTKTNRFQIKDETISQKHMSIDWVNDVWMAQDLGSSNGTTVNGVDIGVKTPYRVFTEDIIRIGVDTRIRVVLHDGSGPRTLATGLQPLKEEEETEEEEQVEGTQAGVTQTFEAVKVTEEHHIRSFGAAKRASEHYTRSSGPVKMDLVRSSEAAEEQHIRFSEARKLAAEDLARTSEAGKGADASQPSESGMTRSSRRQLPMENLQVVAEAEVVEVPVVKKEPEEQGVVGEVAKRTRSSMRLTEVGKRTRSSALVPEAGIVTTGRRGKSTVLLAQTKCKSSCSRGGITLRDWFRQEMVRIPTILHERAEATIREMEIHAEQLKSNLKTLGINPQKLC